MFDEEQVVSRHRSSQGLVTYVRRDDGGLEVWLERRQPQPREMMSESVRRQETHC